MVGRTALVRVAIVIGRAVVVVLLLAPADVVLFFLLDRGVAGGFYFSSVNDIDIEVEAR